MLSPFTSEKKQLVSFCSPSGEELRKFAEELREAIAEVNEMEQIHIQCKERRTHTSSYYYACKHTCAAVYSAGGNSLFLLLQGNWRGNKASSHTAYTLTVAKWTHTRDTALPQVLVSLTQHEMHNTAYTYNYCMCVLLKGTLKIGQLHGGETHEKDQIEKTGWWSEGASLLLF